MGSTPGPGGASKGASRKTKLKVLERARWMRMLWMLKIVEFVPPPWRQRIVGRVGGPGKEPGMSDIDGREKVGCW